MNKAIPNTARVQQTTNGNRGIQQPLLHVGAAGVSGGSATKKMSSPLKLNADLVAGAKNLINTGVSFDKAGGAIGDALSSTLGQAKKKEESDSLLDLKPKEASIPTPKGAQLKQII